MRLEIRITALAISTVSVWTFFGYELEESMLKSAEQMPSTIDLTCLIWL